MEWTAQLRADTSKDENGELNESLRNAILGFSNFRGDVSSALQQTLEGEVRAVVATMTPEELVRNKAGFAEKVDTNVRDSMADLGFKLVSLNIGKIDDENDHYKNLAAKDREAKRLEANILKAEADQGVAVKEAATDQASKKAQQERDLAVAEQERELELRKTAIRIDTDKAKADADVAGELQRELRTQELATRQGETEVVRQQQRKAAAEAERDVVLTQAETQKQAEVVKAEAAKQQAEIAAAAKARQDEIAAEAEAKVAKTRATGEAEAAREEAQGRADAINRTAKAEADKVRETGLAAADVTRAQGKAEADSILAMGKAKAEADRLQAEALAANDGANLKVTLAEIKSRTQITVSTNLGTVMGEFARGAKFVDFGGSSKDGGDLVTNTLAGIPKMFAQLDAQVDALSDTTFGGQVGQFIADVAGPLLGGSNIINGESVAEIDPTVEETEPVATEQSEEEPVGPSEDEVPADQTETPDGLSLK